MLSESEIRAAADKFCRALGILHVFRDDRESSVKMRTDDLGPLLPGEAGGAAADEFVPHAARRDGAARSPRGLSGAVRTQIS